MSLTIIEKMGVAPKAFYFHKADQTYLHDFIILEFISGQAWRKKKRSYTPRQIKEIAKLLAKLHHKKNPQLKPKNYFYGSYLSKGLEYINSINQQTCNQFGSELETVHNRIKQLIPKTETHRFGLIHGDVCPQNIVETGRGLRLVDWESVGLSDPAKDIANVIIDLGLKNNDLKLFLKEYRKLRKDKGILIRAKVYAVLMRYNYFLWELVRSFEIIHKRLPKEYLNKNTVQRHINEAKHQFKQLKEVVELPGLDLKALFNNGKNHI
ncbi:phosphotransferase [Candidatus Woesearchaeota archaeon]|nr:phosphotransferase [Candidatus Woesearchaeota archaeon]